MQPNGPNNEAQNFIAQGQPTQVPQYNPNPQYPQGYAPQQPLPPQFQQANYGPGAQPMNVPPQMMNPNMMNAQMGMMVNMNQMAYSNFVPFKQLIQALPGIACKQQMNIGEVLTGCDLENKYLFFEKRMDKNKAYSIPIFKAKEKSGFCARQCLSNATRPFDIKVRNETSPNEINSLILRKNCNFHCLCLDRPQIKIFYTEEGTEQYIGRIIDNFTLCNYKFTIKDNKGVLMYIITGSCCQPGILCGCIPFNSCQKAEFELRDAKGNLIELINKKGKGFATNLLSDADNFYVNFQPYMDWQHRALIMSTLFLIDFMVFSSRGCGDSNGAGGF